ncbi:MAG: CpsD/CapB family tyrosine-protein kinase [Gammaproteobacteria bacterium]|nr:CpsD/CapB family tyrosine-protein kinase [Gammaproteobacteria bacterium]
MGRLSKALERRKYDEPARIAAAQAVPNTKHLFAEVGPVEDPIAGNLTQARLSPDVMYRNHIITRDIDPVIQTAYKMLRTRILQRMRTNMWQTIAVTSAAQGDGKSISSINLAISLAGDVNHNVCLVDLDLRHSSVANYLGLKPKLGISDCLERKVPVEDALVKTDIDRLVILPNVRTVTHSSELISSPKMHEIAAKLASDPARIVVYDMPPLLAADDMLAFEPIVDSILLVVAEGTTRRTDTMKAFELLEDSNVIGTVLNRSDERTAAYY